MAALNEEQTLLKDQASAWVSAEAPVAKFRAMRNEGKEAAFAQPTWAAMVEMGWTGILIPEEFGGSDLGYLTFGVVLEELGKQLTASPLFASAYVGASALMLAGSKAQKSELLPKIVDGSAIVTLALEEGARHAPLQTKLKAAADGDHFTLTGTKTLVLEGMTATHFIVVARTNGKAGDVNGLSLFVVPADAKGLGRTAMKTMDSRGYAELQLDGVKVPSSALMGPADQAGEVLDEILDRARAGLGAEMLGVGAQSFAMTLDYLKTRKQFGAVIGSFQALGHRAAELFSAMELARSCGEAALQELDGQSNNVAKACSLSKAKVGDFLHEMSNQLIQIHGGIGMTDEFDAGLYLKRARVLEGLYGTPAFHRDRYARLLGF
ncbi:MAG: acyl-CoA dehydrogenase family protein [Parvibaculum sp.]